MASHRAMMRTCLIMTTVPGGHASSRAANFNQAQVDGHVGGAVLRVRAHRARRCLSRRSTFRS
jgi:hypothetical protein